MVVTGSNALAFSTYVLMSTWIDPDRRCCKTIVHSLPPIRTRSAEKRIECHDPVKVQKDRQRDSIVSCCRRTEYDGDLRTEDLDAISIVKGLTLAVVKKHSRILSYASLLPYSTDHFDLA